MRNRNLSHPCPRPSSASDLPSEFQGEWLTPRSTKYIIHASGYLVDHVEPSSYQAKLDANDKLCLSFDGEQTCFQRTAGTAGELIGEWVDQGEFYDLRSDGTIRSKAASYTKLLSGVYTASTPGTTGEVDLETWIVIGSMWIDAGKLHWLSLLANDVCSDVVYDFSFNATNDVLTLTTGGQSFDLTKV